MHCIAFSRHPPAPLSDVVALLVPPPWRSRRSRFPKSSQRDRLLRAEPGEDPMAQSRAALQARLRQAQAQHRRAVADCNRRVVEANRAIRNYNETVRRLGR